MEDTPGRNNPFERGGKRSAVSGAGEDDDDDEGMTPLTRSPDAGRWGESRAEVRLRMGLS